MNKDTPTIQDFVSMAYKGLISGPIVVKPFWAFLIASALFAAIVGWDAINGRGCQKGFIGNDAYSYISTPVCFFRGFVEGMPRAKGWDYRNSGSRRP